MYCQLDIFGSFIIGKIAKFLVDTKVTIAIDQKKFKNFLLKTKVKTQEELFAQPW